MTKKPSAVIPLAHRREMYRLWFEYLKVALQSSDKKIITAVGQSKNFYLQWDDIFAENFNTWWISHGRLFEEKTFVRLVRPGDLSVDPDSLLIEVPLTASPTELTKRIGLLIRAEFDRRQRAPTKSKKIPTAMYRPTAGTEPKLLAIRESLTIYRDVYLKNRSLRGQKLLDAVRKFYLGRKRKAKVPTPMLEGGNSGNVNTLKNLRRYIQKAEKITLNVANGEFPGKY